MNAVAIAGNACNATSWTESSCRLMIYRVSAVGGAPPAAALHGCNLILADGGYKNTDGDAYDVQKRKRTA